MSSENDITVAFKSSKRDYLSNIMLQYPKSKTIYNLMSQKQFHIDILPGPSSFLDTCCQTQLHLTSCAIYRTDCSPFIIISILHYRLIPGIWICRRKTLLFLPWWRLLLCNVKPVPQLCSLPLIIFKIPLETFGIWNKYSCRHSWC